MNLLKCHRWKIVCPTTAEFFSIFKSRSLSLCAVQLNKTTATNVAVTSGPSAPNIGQNDENELVPERLYTKINVKVKGFEYAVLESYIQFLIKAGRALDIKIGRRVALPTRIKKFTVLKSPHIYKKHFIQYEIRTHSRLVQIKEITGTTADVFLEYIQRNIPEGVTMSVYQEELKALPKLLIEPEEANPVLEKIKSKKK